MQSEWQAFIEQHDRSVSARDPRPPGVSAAAAQIFDLSFVGLLSVRGEDAQSFLHAQLSNDMNRLDGYNRLAAYCTPQGRMLAIVRACVAGGGVQLALPRALCEPVRERLRRYVLRARVDIASGDASLARMGIAGEGARQVLERAGLPVPATSGASVEAAGGAVSCIDAGRGRFLLLQPFAEAMATWERLAAEAGPGNAERWRALDIEAGLPNVYPATVDSLVPQMVNLELVGGVSFDKGCYPGQEIVARAHYLGRVKRRMFRFGAPPGASPVVGDSIHDGEGEAVGVVVEAALGEVLGVIPLALAQASLFLAGSDQALRRLDLPYAVTAAA